MTLRNVLQLEEFLPLSDADALAALLLQVEFPADTTAYTWSGLSEKLLEAGIDPMLLVSLDALLTSLPVGGTMFDKLLTSGGVDFSLAGIRTQIAINQSLPISADQQIVLAACLLIGLPVGPRWVRDGIPEEPTLESIAEARATIASEALYQQVTTRYNAVLDQMQVGSIVTWDAARLALGAE